MCGLLVPDQLEEVLRVQADPVVDEEAQAVFERLEVNLQPAVDQVVVLQLAHLQQLLLKGVDLKASQKNKKGG